MRVVVFLGLVMLAIIVPARAFGPDESKWLVSYPVPEDVKAITVTLKYCFWDPKVDGDLASKKVLLTASSVKLSPGAKTVSIQILLNGGKSVITVGNQLFRGRGRLLDESFARASVPKPNSDGFYILAQKPADGKKSATIGDTMDAAAWIELSIDPRS